MIPEMFYPVKPEIFDRTYEIIGEAEGTPV